LLDVDSRLPNLALMKLSRHFKLQGRRVQLIRKDESVEGAEVVYASCVFSTPASKRRVEKLRDYYGDTLILGGSGVDLKRRLSPEIEGLEADYGLYRELALSRTAGQLHSDSRYIDGFRVFGSQIRYLVYGFNRATTVNSSYLPGLEHYDESACGRERRHPVEGTDGVYLLAALAFGACAWRLQSRDEFIGWTDSQRQRNLNLVVNNVRFLILPWIRSPRRIGV
jgi:hypothetical protein